MEFLPVNLLPRELFFAFVH